MTLSFSIVTACKNQREFLKEAADAIVRQDHPHWEWIVVDDASTEDLESLLRSYNDPRIRYFRNATTQRQTRSLNLAIRNSRYDWIVRLDGDDIPSIERLSLTARAINESPDKKLFFGDFDVISENGRPLAEVRYRSPLAVSFFGYLRNQNNPICHPTVCFYKYDPKRKPYLYNEDLSNAQDYELWRRILTDSPDGFGLIGAPLVKYRLVRGALSGALIKEQMLELQSIKSSTPAPTKVASIKDREKEGMYSYRKCYFRFLDSNRPSLSTFLEQMGDALDTFAFFPVAHKAIFFALFFPFKNFLKKYFFAGMYQTASNQVKKIILRDKAPTLSIITLMGEDPKALENTIRSLRQLKDLPFEQILLDTSPQLTTPTLDRLQSEGIIQWKIKCEAASRHSTLDAMNRALELAEGDAVWFLNSGDLLLNASLLKKIVLSLEPSQIAFAACVFQKKHPNHENVWPRKFSPSRTTILSLLGANSIPHQAAVYSLDVFSRIGPFSAEHRRASIYELHFRAYLNGVKSVFYYDALASIELRFFSESERLSFSEDCKEVIRLHDLELSRTLRIYSQLLLQWHFLKIRMLSLLNFRVQ